MKNIALLLLVLFGLNLHSQEAKRIPKKDTIPFLYVGGGLGINNVCGLIGAVVSVRANDNLYLRVGFGVGTWGTKFTGGIKYELKGTNSWGFGLSYSSCSGITNYKTDLEVKDSASVLTRKVTVDLLRSSTINLTASYKWLIRNKHQFYFEFGYAVPIETEPYRIKDGSELSKNGKNSLHAIQPGGLILGVGIFFGVQ